MPTSAPAYFGKRDWQESCSNAHDWSPTCDLKRRTLAFSSLWANADFLCWRGLPGGNRVVARRKIVQNNRGD
jgi:hypothetical protein